MYSYHDLQTPKKRCEKYSQVSLMGWSPVKITIFLNANILVGVLKKPSTPTVIRERSFLDLIEYANRILEWKKIYINKNK